jgi:hypothetical protein
VTAVLFTCAGQRVDIVTAFARAGATTIAADLNPLSPALYHADRRAIVPRVDHADYLDALRDLVSLHDVKLVVPLTDLDHHVLDAGRDTSARRRPRARAGRRSDPALLRQVRGAPVLRGAGDRLAPDLAARRAACRPRLPGAGEGAQGLRQASVVRIPLSGNPQSRPLHVTCQAVLPF